MKIEFELDESEMIQLVKEKVVEEMAERIMDTEFKYSEEQRMYKSALKETLNDICLEKRNELFGAVVEKTADKITRKALNEKFADILKSAGKE